MGNTISTEEREAANDLFAYVCGGDVSQAAALLDSHPDAGEAVVKHIGHPPLMHVAVTTCPDILVASMVDMLVSHGLDVEATDKEGRTALHMASASKCVAGVKALLDHGARADAASGNGLTPLVYAIEAESEKCVEALLMHRVPASSEGGGDDEAAVNSPPAVDVNAVMPNGYRPLHCAVLGKQHAIVRMLLKHGADVNGRIVEPATVSFTPLHVAGYVDCAVCAGELLQRGADPRAQAADGVTPLHVAACLDSWRVAACLIRSCASRRVDKRLPLVDDESARDAVDAVCAVRAARSVGGEGQGVFAIDDGALPGCGDDDGDDGDDGDDDDGAVEGPVSPAPLVPLVLMEDSGERTPMHLAARSNSVRVMRLLGSEMASVEVTDVHGYTPLHYAARALSLEAVVDLVNRMSANVFATDNRGYAASAMIGANPMKDDDDADGDDDDGDDDIVEGFAGLGLDVSDDEEAGDKRNAEARARESARAIEECLREAEARGDPDSPGLRPSELFTD